MLDTSAMLNRLQSVIPADREVRLSDLRALHAIDAEAVYELAICVLPSECPIAVRGLQHLARTLSLLMREGFVIAAAANQTYATTPRRHGVLALDDGKADEDFLRGLYAGASAGDKMRPEVQSDARVAFFLEEHEWDASVRATKLLRVEHEDAQAVLNGSPRYHYHALLDCAREVVRSPNIVYHGLRSDGALHGGWAFCGKPSRRWINTGHEAVRPGFVFLVFATDDGCVFDWDWAPECAEHPGRPRNAEERFPKGPASVPAFGELVLGNVRGRTPAPFKPKHAWYSSKGDCVFWYLSDAVSYADHYDDYLTAFFSVQTGSDTPSACVGIKLKSVSRLIETVQHWARPGTSEGIRVDVDPDKVEVQLSYLMTGWLYANLPKTLELAKGMRVMQKASQMVGKLGESSIEAIENGTAPIPIPANAIRRDAIPV